MANWAEKVLDDLEKKNHWEQVNDFLGVVVSSGMGPVFSVFRPKPRVRLMNGPKEIRYFLTPKSGEGPAPREHVGGATFPTSGSRNPTLTTVAPGRRPADHLIESEEVAA
ncbi:hypothetical protein KIK06_10620 [Nocardiopsis sp. EMB25]|uniref:hypothetical protein n=1 Tax=Nocardiopsis TaxID=2013 RepID=UPI0012683610|nr:MULTISPECIES: hypothetical protein [Nocardiopsis]MCY9784343.1 hypothetical protein [Nocardiopsis sp. EMB25]